MSTGLIRKKSEIFLLFFLLFLILYSIDFVKSTVVGRLRVPSPFDVKLSILIDNQECPTKSYCPGQIVDITNKLENVGSNNLIGNLSTSILNTTSQEIHNEKWSNIDLLLGEIEYFKTNYTIQEKDELGIYSIKSNFTYDENFTDSTCIFRVNKGIGTFRRSPGDIVDTIAPNTTKNYTYPDNIQLWLEDACNSTTAILNKTQGIPSEWVSLFQDKLYLNPYNSTDFSITIPPNTPEGVYDNGSIFIYAKNPYGEDKIREIRLNIIVSNNDFRLSVKVPTESKTVCQGGSVNARINITKINPPEEVKVNMTYQIVDYDWVVYKEKKDDDISIIENETTLSSTLAVPSTTGKYMFLAKLERKSAVKQAYDTFEVISCPTTTETPTGGEGGQKEEILKLEVYKIILNVSNEILTVITGNKTSFIASVNNTGTEVARSIMISVDGIPQDWISVFPSTANIYSGEIGKYLIVIEVPTNAETGIYKLNVKAMDGTESNTVVITLVIGRNPKEIADLLLTELEKFRSDAKRSLSVKDCIDTTIIKTVYDDAEYAVEKGKEEYNNKNYEKAVSWFEYAIPVEKKVVDKVDITLEMELGTSNTSKVLIPPFFKTEEQFQLAGTYLKEKNYEKICDPLDRIKKFILIGLIFWPAMVVILIILIITTIIYYRIKRRRERTKILQEVKERLKKIPLPEGQS